MDIKQTLQIQKNKLIQIINDFEIYYKQNYLEWDIKEITIAHQILGTLILTFKKTEYMDYALEFYQKNDLMDIYNIELEEVKIITNYYETAFIKKKK
jgi:hypothetical protein